MKRRPHLNVVSNLRTGEVTTSYLILQQADSTTGGNILPANHEAETPSGIFRPSFVTYSLTLLATLWMNSHGTDGMQGLLGQICTKSR